MPVDPPDISLPLVWAAAADTSPPWPLAVGVVVHRPGPIPPPDPARERLALALGAYKAGYFLVDVIDVAEVVDLEEARESARAWDRVDGVARAADVDAVVVLTRGRNLLPSPLPGVLTRYPVLLLLGG